MGLRRRSHGSAGAVELMADLLCSPRRSACRPRRASPPGGRRLGVRPATAARSSVHAESTGGRFRPVWSNPHAMSGPQQAVKKTRERERPLLDDRCRIDGDWQPVTENVRQDHSREEKGMLQHDAQGGEQGAEPRAAARRARVDVQGQYPDTQCHRANRAIPFCGRAVAGGRKRWQQRTNVRDRSSSAVLQHRLTATPIRCVSAGRELASKAAGGRIRVGRAGDGSPSSEH